MNQSYCKSLSTLSVFVLFLLRVTAQTQNNLQFEIIDGKYTLTAEGAAHFAELPLRCMTREFPYKTGVAYADSTLAIKPKLYHPAFYGCFDWHSSVHGHWMLVRLLKMYPGMARAAEIRSRLEESLSAEHIKGEMAIFSGKENQSFERTYGWAWLLQLENELMTWNDPLGKELTDNVAPLARQLSGLFIAYLPKMNYPVRVGEHTNLAFSLRLAWDYATQAQDQPLKDCITQTAVRFYKKDVNYPVSWEPGGNDFLSPALEEADLMWRILPDSAYHTWLRKFLPAIAGKTFSMKPGQVKDRTDGKLVHLDGLNLSRAWDLYGIARHFPGDRTQLYAIANEHLRQALPNVASGDYMGEHWLASFAVYALTTQEKKPLPRIAIAGLGIESSTFSPALTKEPAFHAKYDTAVFSTYPFMAADSPIRNRALWIPTIVGHSLPGGAVTRAAYESLVTKTLESLRRHLPYDGLYFDIHGAMSVVGLDDPEGDFIARIRKLVGPKTIISTSMDLHGNVSQKLAVNTDLITDYRLAPHEDAMETKERAVTDLLNRLESGKGKPAYKAWVPVPVLLPGEKTSTRIEPAKSVFKAIAPTLSRPGIVDGGIWVGYPWADEPRNHAVVMVTGDDKEQVTQAAEQLARSFWAARSGYAFVAPTATWTECLKTALASEKHPFFISDMGDNPTAGGAGDVTWTLTQLLSRPEFKPAGGPSLIYASIPGPDLIKAAIAAGINGHVDGYAGAAVDARYAPPVHITGTVESIVTGDTDAEVEAVIRVGSIHIIVTQKRKPYHKEIDFTRLGLSPRKTDIVVVKIGYLEPELYAMRADWLMALTPGGVDQDIEHLPYKRIKRPMFPFDKNMPDPDLSARLMPSSDKLPR